MDPGDYWKTQLQPASRQRIVNRIMDALKSRHLPVSNLEWLHELQKSAVRFEEKIYSTASSQSDYLRTIALKMLTMETKSQRPTMGSSIPANLLGGRKNPPDPALESRDKAIVNPKAAAKRSLEAKEKPAKAARTLSRTSPGKKVTTPKPVK